MLIIQSLLRHTACRIHSVGLAVALAAFLRSELPAADLPPATTAKVQQAIEKARSWLLKQQRPDGAWVSAMRAGTDNVGPTGLVMLALANAGIMAEDPAMVRALDWMRAQKPNETYSVSLQTLALAMLAPDRDRAILERNVAWLEEEQVKQGPTQGSWSYDQKRGGGAGDNSNSQFALLALHEASRAGVRVRDDTWLRAQDYWMGCANPDGSWGYTIGNPGGSGSMTCAGIASVWITAEHVGAPDARAGDGAVSCCGGGGSPDVLERGIKWLGNRFSVEENAGTGGQTWLYYYLYGLERVGRFTARRFIGEHDWYLEGAEMLVRVQDRLTGRFNAPRDEDPVVATSFALLFLAKGRRPVIVAKSRQAPGNDWNQHGHDIAHLVEYVEARWHDDYPAGLSWHVIDTPAAEHEDVLQSPVLWLSGRKAFDLGPDAGPRLRRYIDEGGFIFAEACCPDSSGFDRRLRQLVEEIFPARDCKLRKVPEDHAIWSKSQVIPPELRRPMEVVEIGERTCLVYAPATDAGDKQASIPSLSCLWELGGRSRRALAPGVRREVENAFAIGENVLGLALFPSPFALRRVGVTLAGLPPSQLQIKNADAAERIRNARAHFDKVLEEQRSNIHKVLDDAAAARARAKDLDGLERWEAAIVEFKKTYTLPDSLTPEISLAFRNTQKCIIDELAKLNECYIKTRDTLTEARQAADARVVENERKLLFSQ